MFTLAAALLGFVGTGITVYFKYIRKPPSAADQVERIDRKMMQDEVNRPTSVNDAIDKL